MYLSEHGRCLGHCVCLIRCETSTCCFRLTTCDEVLMLLSHECCELWTKITWKYSSHFLFVLYFTELHVFLQWFSLSTSSPSHSVKVNIEYPKCFIRGEKDASKESNKDRRSDRQRRVVLSWTSVLTWEQLRVLFCSVGMTAVQFSICHSCCSSHVDPDHEFWPGALTASTLRSSRPTSHPDRHTPEPTASVKLTLFS